MYSCHEATLKGDVPTSSPRQLYFVPHFFQASFRPCTFRSSLEKTSHRDGARYPLVQSAPPQAIPVAGYPANKGPTELTAVNLCAVLATLHQDRSRWLLPQHPTSTPPKGNTSVLEVTCITEWVATVAWGVGNGTGENEKIVRLTSCDNGEGGIPLFVLWTLNPGRILFLSFFLFSSSSFLSFLCWPFWGHEIHEMRSHNRLSDLG
ncbi:hypothetical protein V8F06_005088 [Rhypophila decipiens]